MKKLITLLALAFCLDGKGQNEYLALINSTDCTYSKFDSIPNAHLIEVNSSAIDENNHRYFFIGTIASNMPNTLYIINTLTGGVINSFKMISNKQDSLLIGLEYDNSSDTLYGILETDTTKNTYFVWIDLTNGTIHSISALPGQYFGEGSSTYDKNHHRYFYAAGSACYVIDARTGNVIYSYSAVNQLVKYNNTTDKLYGISQPTSQPMEFDSITVSTGVAHKIDTLPLQTFVAIPFVKAMNETHGKYICVGKTTAGPNMLYTIDINTGNIVHQPIDTLFGNNNLIEFQYDNIQDTLFALHWGPYLTTTGINQIANSKELNIYPNPSSSILNVELKMKDLGNAQYTIYDINGRAVKQSIIYNLKSIIDINDLSEGVYNISISHIEGIVNKRLVIVR